MTTKLDAFDYDLVSNYYLNNYSENEFWLFAAFLNSTQLAQSKNAEFFARSVLEKTLFGSKYLASDVSFMIRSIPWRSGAVYTQYDDTAVLNGTQFYVVIEPDVESGNYHIFKCISNNNGSPSTEIPVFNSSIEDGVYNMSDGYTWKYMASITSAIMRKFAANGLIPIVRNANVENVAKEGIYNIQVENREDNFGYERITCDVSSIDIQGSVTRIFLKNVFSQTLQIVPLFEIPNSYIDRAAYIEKSPLSPEIGAVEGKIIQSGVISSQPYISISTPSGFTISVDDKIEILPKVTITGDGSGASAITVFDSSNTHINSIRMINEGDNYTSAIATILDPIGFDPDNTSRRDVRCLIRPIISPKNGHGSNAVSELKSRYLGFSKIIASGIDTNIPDTGIYNKLAIVKNPVFSLSFTDDSFANRVKIFLDELPTGIAVNDEVSQGEVKGIVAEINTEENAIYVIYYDGPYSSIFDDSLPLTYKNANYDISSIEYSPYVSKTGTVLSITDIANIERSSDNSELIKLIVDF